MPATAFLFLGKKIILKEFGLWLSLAWEWSGASCCLLVLCRQVARVTFPAHVALQLFAFGLLQINQQQAVNHMTEIRIKIKGQQFCRQGLGSGAVAPGYRGCRSPGRRPAPKSRPYRAANGSLCWVDRPWIFNGVTGTGRARRYQPGPFLNHEVALSTCRPSGGASWRCSRWRYSPGRTGNGNVDC